MLHLIVPLLLVTSAPQTLTVDAARDLLQKNHQRPCSCGVVETPVEGLLVFNAAKHDHSFRS
jgi:hypothetical protein